MRNIIIILLIGLNLNIYAQQYLSKTLVIKVKSNSSQKQEKASIPQAAYHIIGTQLESSTAMFPDHNTGRKKSKTGLSNIYIIQLKENSFNNFINELSQLDEIEYVTPYYLPELLSEVNDPSANSQYYLPIIDAFNAHTISIGDTNVVIGITDTGLDLLHPDLIDNIKLNHNDPINGIDDDMDGFIDNFRGWDVADNDNNPSRFWSTHGTIVAGMAAATCNNDIGIYSIGYQTKFLPIKIQDSRGYLSAAYQGIVYAADHGCQIINCSWGSQIPNPLCEDVINYAIYERNCLIVAAAGNDRTDQPYYPAACEGVLNVANTDWNDNKFSKSTYGVEVDICAPGTNVLSTYGSDGYKKVWGTSYSAPLVAGAAALVKAQNPDFTGLQVGEQLRITADIIDTLPNNAYFYRHMGRGRLNAFNALTFDSLPSLRISNLEIIGENSTPLPGDILTTTFTLTNYLKQVTSSVVQLTIESDFAKPNINIFKTDTINTLESVSNVTQPMQIEIADSAPYDEIIELDFRFDGPGYNDYQIFKQLINPSYININIPPLETSFTSNGTIGFANNEKLLGKGLIYKKFPNILPHSGIIIGNGRENIASALLDDYNFNILKAIDTTTVDGEFLAGVSSFICGNKYESLSIKINQTSKIYYDENLSGIIFHEYEIINEGAIDINDLAFSIFTNWDIDNSFANHIQYDANLNLFHAQSSTDNNLYAGVALISQDTCVPYAFDLVAGGNGGLDITTDFSDEKKWFAMTNPRLNDNNIEDTVDVASMITIPQTVIRSKDTLNLIFCMVVADSYYELTNKTRLAHDKYLNPELSAANNDYKAFSIFPNPASNKVIINNLSENSAYNLRVYNSMGQLLSSSKHISTKIIFDTSEYNNGIYYFVLASNTNTEVIKMAITK